MGVVRPETIDARFFHPGLELGADGRKVDVQMRGRTGFGSRSAGRALRLLEFHGIEEFAAFFALVPARALVAADRADTDDIAVREKAAVFFAVELFYGLRLNEPRRVEIAEDRLRYLGMAGVGGSAELVEGDAEPVVNIAMNLVVMIAEFARSHALFEGFGFGRGPVFVGGADVERLVAAQAAEARENIGRKHLDQVSEVRNIVHIRQG
jgi:hypothetical protein